MPCKPALLFWLLVYAVTGIEVPAVAQAGDYSPTAVFCADGSARLCSTSPSMIGEDPAVEVTLGYHGLGRDIESFDRDSQTPFDNMAWQMFVAVNWAEGKPDAPAREGLAATGPRVWDGWARPQDLFGGDVDACDNPKKLTDIAIIAKAGGQPDARMAGYLEASTGKPLIDVDGNWVVFDRRLNQAEVAYLRNDRWDLTTVAGQAAFIQKGNTVDFTEGQDRDPPDGEIGAIELKLAWRILPAGSAAGRFYTMSALLDVSADLVADSDKPLCEEVTLALVGMHVIQKNPVRGALKDQWIWATFEHVDNAPLSSDPADPVDWQSYGKYAASNCPVDRTALAGRAYSLFNPGCEACKANNLPPDRGRDSNYLWQKTPPYAGRYLTAGKYGTQVVQCAKPYDLTAEVDRQWRAKLKEVGSVFANYTLIGTQWGAALEPTPDEFWRNAVPDFLSNTTMETYVQTDHFAFNPNKTEMLKGPGSCVGCHLSATLAYEKEEKGKKKSFPADLSFMPGLAQGHGDAADMSQ